MRRVRPGVGRGRTALAAVAAVVVMAAEAASPGALASPAHAGDPRPTPVTPVLSLRRVPDFVSSTVADRRLASALGATMDRTGGPVASACLSVLDPGGRPAFARNPAIPLIPASTMKVETATAALARMGADAHLTTEVRAAAPPADGTVAGDLWLVGGGDPLLATADFASVAGYHRQPRLSTSMEVLADRVVAAGVRRITGGIVGDESRYDSQRYIPSWRPTYATDPEIGPQSALVVNGGFDPFEPRAVPVPSPPVHAARVLGDLLRSRGVAIGAEPGQGRATASASLVTALDSPPLGQVVAVMLQESDNLAAELLVKELGARFGGGGTTAAGLGVVRTTLASLAIGDGAMRAVDGSGLDRSDRLTCDLLQATLARGGPDGVLGRSLPVSGRNGTLARRFTAAGDRVRAKTGSLQGVTGLTGWVTSPDGRPLQFSLLANDLPGEGAATGLQDQVVAALLAWPQGPPPAALEPRPPAPGPRLSPR